MRIALLTMTRDRLPYTQHCFQTLRDNAGCDYDHFVLDQASTDGTAEWLLAQDDLDVTLLHENVGICAGLNLLFDEVVDPAEFDVIVRYDNDCELIYPDTLRVVAELAHAHATILSPTVNGLRNPPPILRTYELDGHEIREPHHMGGIFMAIPANLFTEHGYRYDETRAPWEGDELICPWWRDEHAGQCGYVKSFAVNHYLTTDGQATDDTPYWDRKLAEMAAA